MKILFVCLGNICKSPLAKGILKLKLKEKNKTAVVDSAGFESYHINEPPDQRVIKIAKKAGIDISKESCRLFTTEDFDKFDIIYIMDASNYKDLQYFSRNEEDIKKAHYLMSVIDGKNKTVPGSFYEGDAEFEKAFKLIDSACEIIAEQI